MTLTFEPIRMDFQEKYAEYLSRCPETASDYSFINLWSWAEEYGLNWAWADSLVWIRQTIPHEVFWAPVGPWPDLEWKTVFQNHFKEQTSFIRIPEILLNVWQKAFQERMVVYEAREHWDYLYDIQDLIKLEGKRFHKKKNLLKQFIKKYPFQYVPFDESRITLVMDMQKSWCVWRDCEAEETLSQENRAIQWILKEWKNLNQIIGGAIVVDQKIVAYTIGEPLNENTLVIHFEKGDPEYKGIYQAINQMFLSSIASDPLFQKTAFINREQDLGNEGLRKSKLSYNPVNFIKKYRVEIKNARTDKGRLL